MNIVLFTSQEINQPLLLRDERAVHLCKVLHKKAGDFFEAGVLNDKSGKAQIVKIDAEQLYFSFIPEHEGDSLFPLALIIGFPRPIQLKRLLRGVSSLGVCEVHLTGTELGEKSYLKSGLSERSNAEAALIDGAVQAKSTRIPELFFYDNLAACLSHFKDRAFDRLIALDNVNPAADLPPALRSRVFAGKKIAAAIGSERGWTDSERALLEETGFERCGLGTRVLRTETAAIASAVLLLAAMEVI